MKTLTFISMGMVLLSAYNLHAEVLCTDYGDAQGFVNSTNVNDAKELIASCTPDNFYTNETCATLDYYLTFVWYTSDGKCHYIPSCATCPSGYRLQTSEPIGYKVGDVCYIGDGLIHGTNDQDVLDSTYKEYYMCEKIPQYCAAGYYGITTNGTTGCHKCPQPGSDVGIYTDAALTILARSTANPGGNTSIVGCYISDGKYYDATGTFNLTSECYYKK